MEFKKLIRIDIEPERATERLVNLMESGLPHGKPTQLMRNWVVAGYMLDECGHGIMDFLLAIDKSPMSPQKRMKGLIKFIEHCEPQDAELPAVIAVPVVTSPVNPTVTSPVTVSNPVATTKPRKRQSLLGPK